MEVEKSNDENRKAILIETCESFYSNYFRRQSEKMNLFKHINIEKPTKWFLNLTSDKMSQESPSAKLKKNGPKYEKYDEISKKTIKSDDNGKKYTNKEELQEDMRQFYEDIFKYKPRAKGKNINTFLGELKNHPEVLKRRLTEIEKKDADKLIKIKELKETLDRSNSGKTPGPDGVEKELMSRFWPMLGQTIADSTEGFIKEQKLNCYLERGIIKVILKGDTDGSELTMWRPITLL